MKKPCVRARWGKWERAQHHYGGSGLEHGGDFTAAKRLRRYWLKKGKVKEARILEALVNGSCWFADREWRHLWEFGDVSILLTSIVWHKIRTIFAKCVFAAVTDKFIMNSLQLFADRIAMPRT